MDVLIGKFAPTSYEACKPEYFEKGNLHFETLLGKPRFLSLRSSRSDRLASIPLADSASREQECPSDRRGQYRIRGCEENDAALYFGCGEGLSHALIFYEDCNQKSPGKGVWTGTDQGWDMRRVFQACTTAMAIGRILRTRSYTISLSRIRLRERRLAS